MQYEWLEVGVTDITGRLRVVSVRGNPDYVTLDGSSIPGYTPIERSDVAVRLDYSTLKPLPWTNPRRGLVLGDVMLEAGTEYDGDSRTRLRRFYSSVKDGGMRVLISFEIEFFLFRNFSPTNLVYSTDPSHPLVVVPEAEESPSSGAAYFAHPKKAYLEAFPVDSTHHYRERLVAVLREMGMDAVKHHHEVAGMGQVEFDLAPGEPVEASDRIQVFKYAARAVARAEGYLATFMPKPIPWDNGSGMHIHINLWEDGRNLFYDPEDRMGLSDVARWFIGGILKHADALCAITNPTVNSYKRLVPGYESPVYKCWGTANRSALVRVPKLPRKEGMRLELRFPDPLANPYLASIAVIAAGLDGVRRGIDPGDPLDANAYEADGLDFLPSDLPEALRALEGDQVLRGALGGAIVDSYLKLKKSEYELYRLQVTPWEVYYYVNW